MGDLFTGALLTTTMVVMAISLVLMVIVPIIPGQFIIWLAALIYGLLAGWEELGWTVFIILTLAALVAALFDWVAGWIGAKKGGATNKAIWVGFAVGLVGLILFNAIGSLIGIFAGIVIYEYFQDKDRGRSLKAGTGYLAGVLVSLAVRFIIAVAMVGVFMWRVL